MEVIHLNAENVEEAAARAAGVLRTGGVVLYPTDTLYGLGADAFSAAAVAKIYAIKGRDEKKPIHAIVSDIEMAKRYGEVPGPANILVREFGGKVTLIVPTKTGPTFGFRIPDNAFCIAMVKAFGKPITATSANISGQETGRAASDILQQLTGIDLAVDAGEIPESKPSTVVDLCGEKPKVLREGAVSSSEISSALGL